MNSEHEIISELQELKSPLASYPRTMPYALPQGYFKDMEQELMITVTGNLEATGVNMPFALPDNYFEKLPGQLLQAAKESTTTQQAKPARTRTLWLGVRWAAAAVLILTIGVGSYRIFTPKPSIQQQLDKIPYEDIVAYVEANIDEYETDNIANYFDNNNTPDLPSHAINREAIEYYLQEGEQ